MLTDKLTDIRLDLLATWPNRWAAQAAGSGVFGEIADVQGKSIFGRAVLPPVPVIREDRLDHNIALFQDYCDRRGVILAPHAKTTMAPEIWRRQLAAGAWGLTAASVSQARVMAWLGVERILIANQVVDPASIEWLAATTRSDASPDVICLVDSAEGVRLLDRGLRDAGAVRKLSVLAEVGMADGRAGCRTVEQVLAVAEAVKKSTALQLAGVEGFEGVVGQPSFEERVAAVDQFLFLIRDAVRALLAVEAFSEVDEVFVSAGGSTYFDRVVEFLSPAQFEGRTTLMLRSGCYVVHDCRLYEDDSPLAARGTGAEGRLAAALEVWGSVLSSPEPGLAICGVGKRDVSHDYLPPQPIASRLNGELAPTPPEWVVERVMDHHIFLRTGADHLAPGDWVGFGINHPCTTFDKWPAFALVDREYVIRDIVRTYF